MLIDNSRMHFVILQSVRIEAYRMTRIHSCATPCHTPRRLDPTQGIWIPGNCKRPKAYDVRGSLQYALHYSVYHHSWQPLSNRVDGFRCSANELRHKPLASGSLESLPRRVNAVIQAQGYYYTKYHGIRRKYPCGDCYRQGCQKPSSDVLPHRQAYAKLR